AAPAARLDRWLFLARLTAWGVIPSCLAVLLMPCCSMPLPIVMAKAVLNGCCCVVRCPPGAGLVLASTGLGDSTMMPPSTYG
ncbi:hypothetical protein V8C86DRAFT_2747114, partial [Haematococcus lacustris]